MAAATAAAATNANFDISSSFRRYTCESCDWADDFFQLLFKNEFSSSAGLFLRNMHTIILMVLVRLKSFSSRWMPISPKEFQIYDSFSNRNEPLISFECVHCIRTVLLQNAVIARKVIALVSVFPAVLGIYLESKEKKTQFVCVFVDKYFSSLRYAHFFSLLNFILSNNKIESAVALQYFISSVHLRVQQNH